MRGELDRAAAAFVRVCTVHNAIVQEDFLRDRMECPTGHRIVDGRDPFSVVKLQRPLAGATPGLPTGLCVECSDKAPVATVVITPLTREGRCVYCGSASTIPRWPPAPARPRPRAAVGR